MRREEGVIRTITLLLSLHFSVSLCVADELTPADHIRAVLAQPEQNIDLARAELTFDQMIDPSIDIDAEIARLDQMVVQVRQMAGSGARDLQTVDALKKYLYQAGEWNNFRAYQYDFDDPLGTKLTNKLLHNYMESRKGNCISMPFLFILLGDRLGLDVTASTAPLHVFVKFTDSATGQVYNLETTSGANPTRDAWYREKMPMTDQAIANRIYMATLTRKETVALMAGTVTEYLIQQGRMKDAIMVADAILEVYPNSVHAILNKGSASYRLLRANYWERYPQGPQTIPSEERAAFEYLSEMNMQAFVQAEALGWREPGKEYDEDYLRRVNQAAGRVQ